MDSQRHSVNLTKPAKSQSWTDPVTGEIYPGGNPNAVPQPSTPAPNISTAQSYHAPAPQQDNYAQPQPSVQVQQPNYNDGMKFCKFCAARIPMDAVICTQCGRQVEQLQGAQPQQIVINNSSNASNYAPNYNNVQVVHAGKAKNKWVAFLLCFFLGYLGIHRFYEGKIGTGILYFFTGGLFGIGWFVDLIRILCKTNPYYV